MPKKSPRKKQYVLLMRDTKGVIFGYIDANLCSMGWSNKSVLLWDDFRHLTPDANLKAKYPGCEFFVSRIHSKACPIIVDYKNVNPARPRNHLFTVK